MKLKLLLVALIVNVSLFAQTNDENAELALKYMNTGYPEKADSICKLVLAKDPKHPLGNYAYGAYLINYVDIKKAEPYLIEAEKTIKNRTHLYKHLAIATLAINSGISNFLSNTGFENLRKGAYDTILNYCNKAIALDSKNYVAYILRGEAKKLFYEIEKQKRNSRNNVGKQYNDQVAEIKADFDKAILIDTNSIIAKIVKLKFYVLCGIKSDEVTTVLKSIMSSSYEFTEVQSNAIANILHYYTMLDYTTIKSSNYFNIYKLFIEREVKYNQKYKIESDYNFIWEDFYMDEYFETKYPYYDAADLLLDDPDYLYIISLFLNNTTSKWSKKDKNLNKRIPIYIHKKEFVKAEADIKNLNKIDENQKRLYDAMILAGKDEAYTESLVLIDKIKNDYNIKPDILNEALYQSALLRTKYAKQISSSTDVVKTAKEDFAKLVGERAIKQIKYKELLKLLYMNNNVAITYDSILPLFKFQHFVVSSAGKMGIMDKTGKITLPISYNKIDRKFNTENWEVKAYIERLDSILVLYDGDKMGYANINGKIIIPCIYKNIFLDKYHTYAIVQNLNGLWGSYKINLDKIFYEFIEVPIKYTSYNNLDHGETILLFNKEEMVYYSDKKPVKGDFDVANAYIIQHSSGGWEISIKNNTDKKKYGFYLNFSPYETDVANNNNSNTNINNSVNNNNNSKKSSPNSIYNDTDIKSNLTNYLSIFEGLKKDLNEISQCNNSGYCSESRKKDLKQYVFKKLNDLEDINFKIIDIADRSNAPDAGDAKSQANAKVDELRNFRNKFADNSNSVNLESIFKAIFGSRQ